jgi:hypothetical protein
VTGGALDDEVAVSLAIDAGLGALEVEVGDE